MTSAVAYTNQYSHTYMTNYDIATPSVYWQEGRELVPPSVKQRVKELDDFQRLVRGDFTPLGLREKNIQVRVNYFNLAVRVIHDLLMAFPPEAGISEEYIDMVNTALSDIIKYELSMGTGLFHVHEEGISGYDPRLWFPYPNGMGDAIYAVETLVEPDGRTSTKEAVTLHKLGLEEARIEMWLASGGKLEELIAVEELGALDERAIIPVPRPSSGVVSNSEWGRSLFEIIIPLVAELCRRQSGISSILTDHINPSVVVMRNKESAPTFRAQDNIEAAEDKLVIEQTNLKSLRDSPLFVLEGDYDDMKYLVWDGQLESAERQVQDMKDSIHESLSLPQALLNVLRDGSSTASGTALKKMFASTYTMLETLQHSIIPKLVIALDRAGISHTDVEWLNPLDVLDTVNVEQTTEDPNEEAITTWTSCEWWYSGE